MAIDADRLREAKAIPILEIAGRLSIEGLRRAGREHVGPCPVCGGRDRFSINPDLGLYNCRACGGGDVVALVRLVQACEFGPALDFLLGAAVPDVDPAEKARRAARIARFEQHQEEKAARARARAVRDAREIWHAAAPGADTPAAAYLAARGITFATWPQTLRYIAAHPYIKAIDGKPREFWRGPAMIAAIQDPAGRVAAVHQTWIDPAHPGRKAAIAGPDGDMPAKLVRGSKKGGAVRLSPRGPSGVLIMGEGIETTATPLASGVRPAAAYWAGVDLGNMAGRMARAPGVRYSGAPDMSDDRAFIPPEWCRVLVYLKDGDSDPVKTDAQLRAGIRRAMAARPGLVGYIVPADAGKDFNDMRVEVLRHD